MFGGQPQRVPGAHAPVWSVPRCSRAGLYHHSTGQVDGVCSLKGAASSWEQSLSWIIQSGGCGLSVAPVAGTWSLLLAAVGGGLEQGTLVQKHTASRPPIPDSRNGGGFQLQIFGYFIMQQEITIT